MINECTTFHLKEINFAAKYIYHEMKLIKHLITTYPITCLLILFIWIMCFGTPPSTPLDNVTLIDKWVHIGMFAFLCGTMWIEYLRKHTVVIRAKLIIYAWILPVVMGGLIELLQAYCTGGRRSGELLDFIADAIGVTIAFVFGIFWVKHRAKERKNFD